MCVFAFVYLLEHVDVNLDLPTQNDCSSMTHLARFMLQEGFLQFGPDQPVIDIMRNAPHRQGVLTHNYPSHQAPPPDPLSDILQQWYSDTPQPRDCF